MSKPEIEEQGITCVTCATCVTCGISPAAVTTLTGVNFVG